MNRRIRSASLRLSAIRSTMMAVSDATDPHGRRLFLYRLNLMSKAQARLNWHLDQHRARCARRQIDTGSGRWWEGTPASFAVSPPSDPLHTQWLSGTLTPWEYQHLVRRSPKPKHVRPTWRATGRYCLNCRQGLLQHEDQRFCPSPDPSWWLRVASEIEDDFLYRESAPCGAD